MPSTQLLQIPRELRDMIYRYTLIQSPIKVWSCRVDIRTRADTIKKASYTRSRRTSLLATCLQIYEEASPIMYGENTFELDEYYSLCRIPPKHFSLLKSLWVKIFFSSIRPYESSMFVVDSTVPRLAWRSKQLSAVLKELGNPRLHSLTIEFDTHSSGFGSPHYPWMEVYALPDREVVALWRSWTWGGRNLRQIVECFEALGACTFRIKGAVQILEVKDDELACSLTQMLEEGRISKSTFENAKCREVWRDEDTNQYTYG